jgi:hypothetical protein
VYVRSPRRPEHRLRQLCASRQKAACRAPACSRSPTADGADAVSALTVRPLAVPRRNALRCAWRRVSRLAEQWADHVCMSAHGLCDQRFWLAAAGALLVGALPPSMLLVLRLALLATRAISSPTLLQNARTSVGGMSLMLTDKAGRPTVLRPLRRCFSCSSMSGMGNIESSLHGSGSGHLSLSQARCPQVPKIAPVESPSWSPGRCHSFRPA